MDRNTLKTPYRGAQTAREALQTYRDNSIIFNDYEGTTTEAIKVLEQLVETEPIPTAWIVAQIQDTSGAESSYYSRLLKKWREENGN